MKALLISILFLYKGLFSQEMPNKIDSSFYHKAVIWRGFNHSWTYNHRINRLGNYVYLDSVGKPMGTHFSASGLGADSTFYSTHYSYIENPNLVFYQGAAKITVTGKESQLLTENNEISVYVPKWFRNKGRYKSVINGFEIKSIEKSDQPQLFLVNIEDPFYSEPSKEMKFKLHFNWVGNCRSAECSIFNNNTTYELTVYYLLIGFEIDEAISFQFLNTNSYSWGTDVEPFSGLIKKKYQVFPKEFNSAIIGIKSFGFTLNEEHWLQELSYKVGIDNYFIDKGEINTNINMQFLGWKDGMKQQAAARAKAMFSHKKPGWVTMDLSSIIIQSKNSRIIDGTISGAMYWKGWNAPSSREDAVQTKPLQFNY